MTFSVPQMIRERKQEHAPRRDSARPSAEDNGFEADDFLAISTAFFPKVPNDGRVVKLKRKQNRETSIGVSGLTHRSFKRRSTAQRFGYPRGSGYFYVRGASFSIVGTFRS